MKRTRLLLLLVAALLLRPGPPARAAETDVTIPDGGSATLGSTADAATANTVIGRLQKLLSLLPASLGQKTMALSLAVNIASDQPAITVGGSTVEVSASFTRPADTTAYAALDVVSDSTSAPTVMTFTGCARISGGTGYITKGRFLTDQTTNVARFRLQLYSTAPTAINDNSPYTLLWANRTTRIGYIDFPASATEGTGSTASGSLNKDDRLAFAASGSANVFGILETLDAFTPANAQNWFIAISCEQN